METAYILNLYLIVNSSLLILVIFNQNDNTKESISNKNSGTSSLPNPLEQATWILLTSELIALILNIKANIL
jgi:hypothetical protein